MLMYDCQMGFLDNFVKVFPNLASRPLYITGESYAGMYIVSTTPFRHGLRLIPSPALHHKSLLRDG